MKTYSRYIVTVAAVLGVLAVGAGAFAYSGLYNVGADDEHTAPMHALLQTIRERSVHSRADALQVPQDLADPARIRQGAGNYAAMCTGCHLAPGMGETELSKGLYPAPPDLTRSSVAAAEAFWVIKHGIKSSGMPAWGLSMGDEYIWNMAAFLQVLPELDAVQYRSMVASSGGHSHGGGETGGEGHADKALDTHDDATAHHAAAADESDQGHPHPPGAPAEHHDPVAADSPGMVVHKHADGTVEAHPAPESESPPTASEAEEANDGHDHQH